MLARKLAASAGWSLLSHVLHRGSLMLAAIILARTLNADAFAAYGYFQITTAMLATYGALGLGVTASRFFSEVQVDTANPPLGTLLLLSALLSLCSFAVVMLLPAFVFSAGLLIPKWMVGLGVAVTILGVVPGGAVLGLEKYNQSARVSLFSAAIVIVMAVYAAALGSSRLAMWGLVSGLATQALGQLGLVVRALGWKRIVATTTLSPRVMGNIAIFAGPMTLVSMLAGSGSWLIGRLVLTSGGTHEFALYTIGLQWLALGLLLPGIASRVIFPRLVRSTLQESKSLASRGAALAIAPALALTCVGMVAAQPLIGMYGANYAHGWPIIPLFLLVATIHAPTGVFSNALIAKNGQLTWLAAHGVTFACLLAAMAVMPQRSALYAGIAQAIAALVLLGQAAFIHRRMHRAVAVIS